MPGALNTLLDTPIGRAAYLPVKRLVRFARRQANPGVPLNHEVRKVNCLNRQLKVEVRRWSPSDDMALEQCFGQQQYDMPGGAHGEYLDKLYGDIVATGKRPLIVDCGANIGTSALWFSVRYPEAHIVAIEPAPDNFELLSRNCRGLNAELLQAGIGALDGSAWLADPNGGGMGYRTNGKDTGIEVRIVSLATVMASKPESSFTPFLLKVDIEGAERTMFTASPDLLNQFPLIVMEPHDWMFPGEHTSAAFFRFHADMGREFAMRQENVASIAYSNPNALLKE
jgi:FkbM family methyltransferase